MTMDDAIFSCGQDGEVGVEDEFQSFRPEFPGLLAAHVHDRSITGNNVWKGHTSDSPASRLKIRRSFS